MGQVTAPTLAQMKGADLVELVESPKKSVPTLAMMAFAKSTTEAHYRWIRELSELPIVYTRMMAPDALVSWLAALRLQRRWKWSTTARNMAALAGALILLPAYRQTSFSIRLGDDPTWRMATQAVRKRMLAELPHQPQAASYTDIKKAIATTSCLASRAVLVLAWAFCGRVGDILKLRKDELQLQRLPTGAMHLTATFLRAKTSSARGPYTLHTAIDQLQGSLLEKWLQTRRSWIFPREITTSRITTALRQVRPDLECRSIRRGALQTLAASGVSEATVLEFSAHTSVGMLRRYLGWGTVGSLRKEQMTNAALALAREAAVQG